MAPGSLSPMTTWSEARILQYVQGFFESGRGPQTVKQRLAQLTFPKSYLWPNDGFARVSAKVASWLRDGKVAPQIIAWLKSCPRVWSMDMLSRHVIFVLYMHAITEEPVGAAPLPKGR